MKQQTNRISIKKSRSALSRSLLIVMLTVLLVIISLASALALASGYYSPPSTMASSISTETLSTTLILNSTRTTTSLSTTTHDVTVTNSTTLTTTFTNSSQLQQLESLIGGLQRNNSNMQATLSRYSTEVIVLNASLSSESGSAASLSSQISSQNSQISSLSSASSNLQRLLGLQNSTIEAKSVAVSQNAGATTLITTFKANYAGYIVVTGTSSTTNGFIQVLDSYPGYPDYQSTIGTGGQMVIPILPGTIEVYFGNSNLLNSATASITVTYYN